MNKEEAQKVLEELYTVRPEMLNDKAKRLFEAIMQIADERDKAYKIIDKMAEKMVEDKDWFYSEFDNYTKQDFIEYFKKVVDEDVKD
jgi:hypothetical protein